MPKAKLPTTPQQRSNLARKAAQARWSQSSHHCEERSDEAITHTVKSVRKIRCQPDSSWLANRFCLRLEQDPAGDWLLVCPSGNRLPATHSEISLWLDLQTLNSPNP